jgi:hypothetical protein
MNITSIRRRLSPSTVLATVALVAAGTGTAVAAGPIITDPSQIAPGVVNGLHIEQQSIGKADLDDPYLRVKVNSDGSLNGNKNDNGFPNVEKVSRGVYDVSFNSTVINGSDGSSDESLFSKNCAFSAQARGALAHSVVSGPGPLRPNTVRVQMASFDDRIGLYSSRDNAFDLIAVC